VGVAGLVVVLAGWLLRALSWLGAALVLVARLASECEECGGRPCLVQTLGLEGGGHAGWGRGGVPLRDGGPGDAGNGQQEG
jgi:hypothetical protein